MQGRFQGKDDLSQHQNLNVLEGSDNFERGVEKKGLTRKKVRRIARQMVLTGFQTDLRVPGLWSFENLREKTPLSVSLRFSKNFGRSVGNTVKGIDARGPASNLNKMASLFKSVGSKPCQNCVSTMRDTAACHPFLGWLGSSSSTTTSGAWTSRSQLNPIWGHKSCFFQVWNARVDVLDVARTIVVISEVLFLARIGFVLPTLTHSSRLDLAFGGRAPMTRPNLPNMPVRSLPADLNPNPRPRAWWLPEPLTLIAREGIWIMEQTHNRSSHVVQKSTTVAGSTTRHKKLAPYNGTMDQK